MPAERKPTRRILASENGRLGPASDCSRQRSRWDTAMFPAFRLTFILRIWTGQFSAVWGFHQRAPNTGQMFMRASQLFGSRSFVLLSSATACKRQTSYRSGLISARRRLRAMRWPKKSAVVPLPPFSTRNRNGRFWRGPFGRNP